MKPSVSRQGKLVAVSIRLRTSASVAAIERAAAAAAASGPALRRHQHPVTRLERKQQPRRPRRTINPLLDHHRRQHFPFRFGTAGGTAL
ncbi:polycystic kidney disease protein 1-like 2-like protein [Anopheles sinensis]|uniref:Polycystic kidney disease protein 1-like 2-like protein n=1 Tax=Anopheles sinensis TaxID=74873 RepID=A0A084WUZ8_ANOSI|nr:polycystic kidney disease protein 1-like 2-like protein [Anopheles sinensis]